MSNIRFMHKPCDSDRVTSEFGTRWGTFHNGIDVGATTPGVDGDKLYAVADGVVGISKVNGGGVKCGFGYYIVIDHSSFCTLYGHMTGLYVKEGQKVKSGEVIGYMGTTGTSTGTHLHFEVREGSYNPDAFWRKYNDGRRITVVDPLPYFLESFETESKFTDIKDHWGEVSIKKVVTKGLMQGYPDGTFKPDKPVTRAEMAVILNNLNKQ